jgi:hypothetical protein
MKLKIIYLILVCTVFRMKCARYCQKKKKQIMYAINEHTRYKAV